MVQESVDARLDFERERITDSDLDLEQVDSEDEDYTSSPADYQITYYPADFSLEVLHEKWLAGEIAIPSFHRDFVWKPVQSSRLIESFLVGLPVPPVYVYAERRSQNYLVIDGQQRLKSIFYFFRGHFGEDDRGNKKEFRLTGLNPASRFSGRAFADLWKWDRERLNNAILRTFIVHPDSDDDTIVYHISERLNTGGTQLTNQEIRNCVYHGNFAKSLERLNGTPEWRKIAGKESPDSRKRDIELILRFFAMRDISGYRKPMKDFMSRFMRKNRDLPGATLAQSEWVFHKTCGRLVETLGERPFHVRNSLNAAILDAVMVAFSENLDRIPEDIGARYEHLRSDDEFVSCTRQKTTDEAVVEERLTRAKLVLFG